LAFCLKVETHNSPSALDPFGGALTGIVGVNRDILGCGMGAKPIFNTNVFCLPLIEKEKDLPDRILTPRRILEGVRRGVEEGGNKSGIPTVNGALVFDKSYLAKPLIYCGTGGIMPRVCYGKPCESKQIIPGDKVCMIGGRIGKDGVHGATFSSMAFDEQSPVSAVQLGDPITQKRMTDFILEARDLGLYNAITDNGAGGLSSSVGEMAELSNGVRIDLSHAKTKYPGLTPFELVVSESQERMTLAVPPEHISFFLELAKRRGVEVSVLGDFTDTGRFEIYYEDKLVGDIELDFLHNGVPQMHLHASWKGVPPVPKCAYYSFDQYGAKITLDLLSRPNIASKEWIIRQYDHEVQGSSVIKPLQTVYPGTLQEFSSPNNAAVLLPDQDNFKGIAVASGICPRLSKWDTYLMAQSAVDEAIRNLLCVGIDFGRKESILALVDNFCWPDPVNDPEIMGALVRACYGLKDAAVALGAPIISGKDSMKNDYRGSLFDNDVHLSVTPTLLITAVACVSDINRVRTSDFKNAGDFIYFLGAKDRGLIGSELYQMFVEHNHPIPRDIGDHSKTLSEPYLSRPNWRLANNLYSWLGRSIGKEQARLRSLHDISEGGLFVALAESLISRGLGATLSIPEGEDLWDFAFGEGFHSFITSVASLDAPVLEAEWMSHNIPFFKLGEITPSGEFEVFWGGEKQVRNSWVIPVNDLRRAWLKEGYWE